eukprot:TRINITY_DN4546_c0_g1_i1.p1 TRINITY_DN4546_c0_g1~~TRINITY_DN4546_c0_g1_i1.p1  ORF type:complete len:443 (-),score=86.48 TRINITY_DN4546_c0_g1_i1:47-1375(-)
MSHQKYKGTKESVNMIAEIMESEEEIKKGGCKKPSCCKNYRVSIVWIIICIAFATGIPTLWIFVHPNMGIACMFPMIVRVFFAFSLPTLKLCREYVRIIIIAHGVEIFIFLTLCLCTTKLTPSIAWISSLMGIVGGSSIVHTGHTVWKSRFQRNEEIIDDANKVTADDDDDDNDDDVSRLEMGTRRRFRSRSKTSPEASPIRSSKKKGSWMKQFRRAEFQQMLVDGAAILLFTFCFICLIYNFAVPEVSPVIYPGRRCGELNTSLVIVPKVDEEAFKNCRNPEWEITPVIENLKVNIDLLDTFKIKAISTTPIHDIITIHLRCNARMAQFSMRVQLVSPSSLSDWCQDQGPIFSQEPSQGQPASASSPVPFLISFTVSFIFNLVLSRWYWILETEKQHYLTLLMDARHCSEAEFGELATNDEDANPLDDFSEPLLSGQSSSL